MTISTLCSVFSLRLPELSTNGFTREQKSRFRRLKTGHGCRRLLPHVASRVRTHKPYRAGYTRETLLSRNGGLVWQITGGHFGPKGTCGLNKGDSGFLVFPRGSLSPCFPLPQGLRGAAGGAGRTLRTANKNTRRTPGVFVRVCASNYILWLPTSIFTFSM